MRLRHEARLAGAVAIVFVAASVHAQTPVDPSFEVASIKLNTLESPFGGYEFQPGGRFTASNLTTLSLLGIAFRKEQVLPASRIQGWPDWAGVDRYNIAAKVDTAAPQDLQVLSRQAPGYLRSLLADRFKLKAHWETRQLPTYALVLDRKDGRLGPQLRASTIDCSMPPPDRPCGLKFSGVGILAGVHVNISSLVGTLTTASLRVVQDHTGLTGGFDFDLRWTPEAFRLSGVNAGGQAVDPNIPSIFDAVREQLGLKLESTTGPVDMLVIDHIEHPTED